MSARGYDVTRYLYIITTAERMSNAKLIKVPGLSQVANMFKFPNHLFTPSLIFSSQSNRLFFFLRLHDRINVAFPLIDACSGSDALSHHPPSSDGHEIEMNKDGEDVPPTSCLRELYARDLQWRHGSDIDTAFCFISAASRGAVDVRGRWAEQWVIAR